jgi:hypothetical protein
MENKICGCVLFFYFEVNQPSRSLPTGKKAVWLPKYKFTSTK